jgi:hypothetical protein
MRLARSKPDLVPARTMLRAVQTRRAPDSFHLAPVATVRAPAGAGFAPGRTDPDCKKRCLAEFRFL